MKLGKIGENLPPSDFKNVINLNTICSNFPIFDHLAEKDGYTYVFSTKARKRLGLNNKLNSSYNILYNSEGIARKFTKAQVLLEKNGYDIHTLKYCFLVAPLEQERDCTFYWGELTEINAECTPENIIAGNVKNLRVNVSEPNLARYKVFGVQPWSVILSQLTS
jgi:hypothetical protein